MFIRGKTRKEDITRLDYIRVDKYKSYYGKLFI